MVLYVDHLTGLLGCCTVPGKTGLGWSASHFLLCYCTLRAAAALHNKLCSGRDLISSPPILFRNRGKMESDNSPSQMEEEGDSSQHICCVCGDAATGYR